MRRALFILMVLVPAIAGAQSYPMLLTVVGRDTAWSGRTQFRGKQDNDTLRVQVAIGDTLRIKFFAKDWPEAIGYWIGVNDQQHTSSQFNPVGGWSSNANGLTFNPLSYSQGDFLIGPDLPTSQQGILMLGANKGFQVGLATLGEKRASGSGFLGALSYLISGPFAGTNKDSLMIFVDRFNYQAPPGQINIYTALIASNPIIVRIGDPPAKTYTADFNGDGSVDFQDFFLFADHWAATLGKNASYDRRFDLVHDGKIDFADFFLFVDNFGKPPKPIS